VRTDCRPLSSGRFFLVLGLLLALVLSGSQSVLALTFGSPVRISTNTGESGSPSIAAVGNYVYVTWMDYTSVSGSGTEPEIWLRVSSNNGAAFGSAIRITTNTGDSAEPSVAASGSYVYVVWEDYTPVTGSGTAPEIWMRASANNGASFGSAIRITTNTGYSQRPHVAATGNYVYVVWYDSTPVPGSGSSSEIWMRVSSNNGASFGSPIRISTNTGDSRYPSVAAVGNYVYVAWQDDTPVTGSGGLPFPEIWMRASSNFGGSFGSPIRITTNIGHSESPSIAAYGSYVYVAWQDNTQVPGSGIEAEVWLRVSSNYGTSFGPSVRISTNTTWSWYPSIAAFGSSVYVAWADEAVVSGSGGQPEVWLRVSSNNGATFGSAVRVTTNTGWSVYPSVAVSESRMYVAWQDSTSVPGSGTASEIWIRTAT